MIPLLTMLSVLQATPADSVNRFRITVANGAISGTEEYHFEQTPNGPKLLSTSHIQRPNGTLDVTQVQTFTPGWGIDRYHIDVTVATGPQVLEAWRDGDTVRLQATAGTRGQSGQVPLRPRTVVLDNLIVSHYQVLLDLYRATPDTARQLAWQFVVPQVVAAVRGTVSAEPGPAGLMKYSVEVAGTLVEVWADSATNRLMRISVPLQRVEMIREGFTMPPAGAPAAPAGPPAFLERDVTFPSAGLSFPATLCLPASRPARARVPLVVLVHGSGPNDRDETIGPNKPFRDIAHALAAAGIATLRYDKRTFAFRPADWRRFTVDQETIDDAVAAVRYARTLSETDTTRVYLLGHSLGGTLAPIAARRLGRRRLAGVILLAPGARVLDDAIAAQLAVRMRLTGQPDDEIERQILDLKAQFARIRSGATADTDVVFGAPAHYWRDLWSRHPLDSLRALTLPVLVIQGGADYQVTKADYDLVQQALAGKPETARESHWLPDLNHLLMHVEGESTGTEYGREGRVDARVTDIIAAWIARRPR